MIERNNHPERPYVVASWVLIWFGTILAVNPRAPLSGIGAALWAAGFMIQMVIVARWTRGRPGSGAAVAGARSWARRGARVTRHRRHQPSTAG